MKRIKLALLILPTITLFAFLYVGSFSFPNEEETEWVSGTFSLDCSLNFEGSSKYGSSYGVFVSDQDQKPYQCPSYLNMYIYSTLDLLVKDEFKEPLLTDLLVEKTGEYPNVFAIKNSKFDTKGIEDFKAYYHSSMIYQMRYYAPVGIALLLFFLFLRSNSMKDGLIQMTMGLIPYFLHLLFVLI